MFLAHKDNIVVLLTRNDFISRVKINIYECDLSKIAHSRTTFTEILLHFKKLSLFIYLVIELYIV